MAPAPGPTSTEQALEYSRQAQIEQALNNLQEEAAAINKAIAAVQQNAPFTQKEQQIFGLPGKFSQPVGQIAALQARKDEISILTLQLQDELSVPGAKTGLGRYDASRGRQYNPPQEYQNISFRSAPAASRQQGLTEAQLTPNELSAMSMMANQAAADAFSNAIAAGATVAEATSAAENAAQTAAQQAATQVGIDPNSPNVTEVAMNAVNTQAVDVGRLAGMTPEAVAAAAQQAVTLAQEGKIGKNTLNELGLLNPFGLAITAPEVDARRTREAQEIMEQGILAPAPVSPPAPVQNPLGTGRGVPLPEPNPLQPSTFGPKESNVLNIPAPPPVESTLLNPAFNVEGFTVDQAAPAYSDPKRASVAGTTFGQTIPGLGPDIGLTAPQAFGVTGYSGGFNNLNDIGFRDANAQPPDYTNPQMSAAHSFFNNPAPVTSFGSYPGQSELESVLQGSSVTRTPGTLTSSTMMPGFTNPAPVTSMPAALTGFPSFDVTYNAPQISAPEQIAPAASFFSAPEPVAPDATPVGSGTIVSGVPRSVPGISISPIGMPGAYAGYDDTMNSTAGSFSGTPDPPSQNPRSVSPDPPSPNPSRGKTAAMAMMDVEAALASNKRGLRLTQ